MKNFGSWRFWVIAALALTTLACAGKRERREEAREMRRERAEQKRAERAERNETRRADRQAPAREQTAAAAAAAPAAALTPVSTAPGGAAAEATVVFMRPGNAGGNVAASLFDVTSSGEAKFIGILRPNNKIIYPVQSGQYTFMVVSEVADFMQATVVGGKTYYSLVTPRSGGKARFSLKPVRGDELDGSQFAGWDRSARTVTNTPTTVAWARENAAMVADKRDRHWPEWSSKPESARASQSLNAEDGR
jgi:hypothetical protein